MGGRGAGAGGENGGMWDGMIEGDGGGNTTPDLPARMNRMYNGNNMSVEHTISVFEDKHGSSKTEHLIAHDDDGFVSVYSHGGKGSVGFTESQVAGKHVIHNHPNNSNFSKTDLMNLSTSKQKSITATSSKGHRYKAEKTDKFDAKGWENALNNAKPKNKITSMEDYNNELHNWMTQNAHKYGVKYTRN